MEIVSSGSFERHSVGKNEIWAFGWLTSQGSEFSVRRMAKRLCSAAMMRCNRNCAGAKRRVNLNVRTSPWPNAPNPSQQEVLAPLELTKRELIYVAKDF